MGGFIGGLSVSNQFWIVLMPISLSILWNGFKEIRSNFSWGFSFVFVSHFWLLHLHPLTWLGYTWLASLIISLSILLICSIAGGGLISLWGLIGKKIFLKNLFSYSNFQISIKVLFLAFLWALGELTLKQTPFFWIGISESLIPGDLPLAGLARWCGASGLCVIQILIGFWIFFIYKKWKNNINFRNLLFFGIVTILACHFLGAFLISQNTKSNGYYPIAVWQTNIPTREKRFIDNKTMSKKLINAQKEALSRDAKLLIAPEGTLNKNFIMDNQSLIDTLAGGFRVSDDHLKSTLLAIKKGNKTYTSFIDKNRLVPLGENVPRFLNRFSIGFSSLGGLRAGEDSRYFNWDKTPPLAIAICYEISDGFKIRKAIESGSELIISIANLDPYPVTIQQQFISLASMRSIENNRDNVIISNTGPSGLIRNNGRISNLINSSSGYVKVVYPNFYKQKTIYVRFGEKPFLVLFILLISLNLKYSRRSAN